MDGTEKPSATPTGDPIMGAKLRIPAVVPWVVRRGRLFDRLAHGVAGPVTLVSAPAGSGKTVLASSWLATCALAGPVAWINLDDGDAQPGVFWSYVLAGLSGAGVPVAPVGTPARPDEVDQSLLIRLAAAVSERPEPVTLVLDNAEVLAHSATPAGLAFLVDHAAPQLRLVLLTRVDPALPLHRYRVAGSMTEIRLAELAFDADETRDLLAAHDVHIPATSVAALAQGTNGWAASLRLAALSLRNRPDTDRVVPHCASDQSDIADYFVAEVLNAQPPDVRDFLLRTSVVDRLWPGLAVELSGRRDAARTLAALAHANTFAMSCHDGCQSYEYYPMVRDLLRAQMVHETPGRVASLHRRAARWLASSGRLADAAGHAAKAGDWAEAATLVVTDLVIARLLAGPDTDRYMEMFADLPAGVDGPEAAVVRAAVALVNLDPAECAKHLARAEELVGDGAPDRVWALRVTAAVTGVACAGARADTDATLAAAACAEAVLADADARGLRVPPDVRALVLSGKGAALLRAGDFAGAAAAAGEALRGASTAGARYLRLPCLGGLALVEAVRGHLRRAADLARKAYAAADERALPADARPSTVDTALAWVHAEEYDLAAARRHADLAAASTGLRADPTCAGVLAVVRARLLRARGDVAGASAVLDHARVTTNGGPDWLVDRLDGADPAAADPDRLAAVLRRDDLPLDQRVEAWLLAASAELALGRPEPARAALDRALRLAEPERLRRPIVETSAALRRFLRQDRGLADRHAWLGAAVTGVPEARRGAPSPGARPAAETLVVEPLTEKEREVLRYLSALFSTEEIARKMFVSVNTVKTHIRGVLRKLSATRRNEAVRRARELGLV